MKKELSLSQFKEKVEGLNFSEINIHRRNLTPLSINACKSRGGTGGREGGW